MEPSKLKQRLYKAKPYCILADHLFGKEHGIEHKMISGLIIMALGVLISKSATHHSLYGFGHYLADGFGYLIHGIGAMPFGEWLATVGATASGAIVIPQPETEETTTTTPE